jgi:hypothetical protein
VPIKKYLVAIGRHDDFPFVQETCGPTLNGNPPFAFTCEFLLVEQVQSPLEFSAELLSQQKAHFEASGMSRAGSSSGHEISILTWSFAKEQVGVPDECWLLQASGNCWSIGAPIRAQEKMFYRGGNLSTTASGTTG